MSTSPALLPLDDMVLATTGLALAASTLVVAAARKMRQPAVIGELLTGIVLGPSVLGLLPGDPVGTLFPTEVRTCLHAVSQIGLVLFMFLTGWELDVSRLTRQARSLAATSTAAMVVPFGAGVLGASLLYARHSTADAGPVDPTAFLLYMGTAFAITAFPVLARLLADKGMHRTPTGSTALACAALADVLAWCLLVVVVFIAQSTGAGQLVGTLAGSAAFIAVCVFVVRPLSQRVIPAVADRFGSAPAFLLVSSGVLACSFSTSLIGIHAIFGAFLFGVVMPRRPADLLHRTIAVPIRTTSALLLPVFFVVTGLSVDVTDLGPNGLGEGVLILALACAGKFVGTVVPARLSGLGWRTCAGLGVLMNTRGLTELVVLEIGRQMHVIDDQLFTLMVLMALVTTAMASPLLDLINPDPGMQRHFLGAHRPGSANRSEFEHQAG